MGQGTMPPYQMTMDNNNKRRTESDALSHEEVQPIRCKCVLLGDGAVGKTSLTVSYTTNGYPSEYIPTAFDNYSVVVTVDNRLVQVQLCDTAGQDDFNTLRTLCYPDTNVFLVCFSVVSPTSFHNVVEKWVPEIRRIAPKIPIVLIGTQSDLRNDVKVLIDLAARKERAITENTANTTARQLGAVRYIECSALTQHNLKEVFDTAIFTGIQYAERQLNDRESKERRSGRKGKTKANDVVGSGNGKNNANGTNGTVVHEPSLKNSKPGWKKLCCFIT